MAKSPEISAIWKAQGKACAICGIGMIPVHQNHPTRGWTIEHVYNHASKRYFADGNKLITHAECNNRKGDREPTGCEVIQLHAANARIGLELTPRDLNYSDPLNGPSALAVALEMAMAA